MTLFMIGLGLSDAKDVSVKGLEIIKNCGVVYLEGYTSKLQCNIEDLEKLYGKKIKVLEREFVENRTEDILMQAKDMDVAFLIIGDPMCATTHLGLRLSALQNKVPVEIIHNASIVSAIGVIGLELYKYGKITSIPFHNSDVKTPLEVYKMNKKNGLHTLFLLDLDPINSKFLTIKEACEYLISNGIKPSTLSVGCARIGSKSQIIGVSSLKKLEYFDYGEPPYCIVIPGKLHFMEEEALKQWRE